MGKPNTYCATMTLFVLWVSGIVLLLLLALCNTVPTFEALPLNGLGWFDTCLICMSANPLLGIAVFIMLVACGAAVADTKTLLRSMALRHFFVCGLSLCAALPLLVTPFWWVSVAVVLVTVALPLRWLLCDGLGFKQLARGEVAEAAKTYSRYAVAARRRNRHFVAALLWDYALLLRHRSRRLAKRGTRSRSNLLI